jgi:hypothetical protein
MRFLADENFAFDAVESLRQKGHDVVRSPIEILIANATTNLP